MKATIADWIGLAGGLSIVAVFLRAAWVLRRVDKCLHSFHYAPHQSTDYTVVEECSKCPATRSRPRWSR